ncbi:MAG: hypothetical protein H6744_06975 [Deltaproteobacteria bacterium]|nr:hypothetical protein [Deltaproteobacteria bacterium]MCB9786421.1 hypothetical protein [Deltaproteobacteria bacterium]
MLSQSLSHTQLLSLPILAMLLFAGIFTTVVVVAWLRGRHDPEHQRLAALPLADDARDTLGGHHHG